MAIVNNFFVWDSGSWYTLPFDSRGLRVCGSDAVSAEDGVPVLPVDSIEGADALIEIRYGNGTQPTVLIKEYSRVDVEIDDVEYAPRSVIPIQLGSVIRMRAQKGTRVDMVALASETPVEFQSSIPDQEYVAQAYRVTVDGTLVRNKPFDAKSLRFGQWLQCDGSLFIRDNYGWQSYLTRDALEYISRRDANRHESTVNKTTVIDEGCIQNIFVAESSGWYVVPLDARGLRITGKDGKSSKDGVPVLVLDTASGEEVLIELHGDGECVIPKAGKAVVYVNNAVLSPDNRKHVGLGSVIHVQQYGESQITIVGLGKVIIDEDRTIKEDLQLHGNYLVEGVPIKGLDLKTSEIPIGKWITSSEGFIYYRIRGGVRGFLPSNGAYPAGEGALQYTNITYQPRVRGRAAIQVHNLNKRFKMGRTRGGDRIIFSNMSIDIYENQLVAIAGPSGQGKSTFLNILGGKEAASGGSVMYVGGKRPRFVPQQELIQKEVTVRQHLMSCYPAMQIKNRTARAREVNEVMRVLRLDELESQSVKTLSGGQQKRVNVALGLIGKPQIICLDEPTSGLDPGTEGSLLMSLGEYVRNSKEPMTVLIVIHPWDNIDLFDDIVLFGAGGICYYGPTDERLYRWFRCDKARDVFAQLADKQRAIELKQRWDTNGGLIESGKF